MGAALGLALRVSPKYRSDAKASGLFWLVTRTVLERIACRTGRSQTPGLYHRSQPLRVPPGLPPAARSRRRHETDYGGFRTGVVFKNVCPETEI